MSYKLFVTGTDTDVGKTFVSQSLLIGALRQEFDLSYWKPVQTGHPDSDLASIKKQIPDLKARPTSFVYKEPASPDQAASLELRPAPRLEQLLEELQQIQENTLIEGAGGLLVPLNEDNETWLSFLKKAGIPCIVVARTGLGTLNHTALTLRTLDLHNVPVAAVILSGKKHEANERSLSRMFPEHRFLHLDSIEDTHSSSYTEACQRLWCDLTASAVSSPSSLLALDQKHCWHPYTQHKGAATPLEIKRAEGPWLHVSTGEKLIDGTSSWWSNTIGHGRPEIAEAIFKQQQTIDHIIFAGATHEGAVKLSQRLSQLTEHQFPRVFFTDNGSCAVEVGLKIAAQMAFNRGDKGRTKFLSLEGAYHGDTFGAMSVGGTEGFHGPFSPFQFESLKIKPVTAHPSAICPEGAAARETEIQKLKALFSSCGHELAAVVLEPMVQGASGMNMHDLTWLRSLVAIAKDHQVPVIFDEVFTGLGRCGAWFAYQKAGVEPDIICLAKGLTGGNLPLAVTMTTDRIFEQFYSDDKRKALYHGHTYTANAICCAAANATLDIYEREDLIKRSAEIESRFKSWIKQHEAELGLAQARAMGSILAWEIPGSGLGDYFNPIAARVPEEARKFGLFLRPLGNTMYFLPALTITDEELSFCLNALEKTVRAISSYNA
ncbi:adenosylmethionine--8-amino-7-oxononanoate transaminase [Pseudobacteriovorax antillogorgiicola]|uniref:Multifunctional fusion protein n=1 Tax=Pseudobacteriovorax antillogorgiicola TaxID=1513793 RepID=A0A1Y6BXU0_9BACT|nr:adenosylmethionine--8-amino-7-oxononanoate transaminase [Pseudobacteriovorax antillogorgiicola]TCS50280.1 dethiobiotin synthase/adenosylmethionine-8-amino-7-oxononanoate transaminase,TIGR00508 [Pseudobacteriovorax antillogorgiicola]SMF33592.1 dethiobiotin synthase/adenosylmethionine-8-amino-7-oxononanoate transaminase,TIGR00508 [Pseudobacteriovorax antillogorgiicola]